MRTLLLVVGLVAGAVSVLAAQRAPATGSERFENWLFTPPPGWTSREDVDGLVLTASDGQATIRLLPGEELSSMGLKRWLDGQPTIVIDYSRTSFFCKKVRDEIREIEPNVYLGKVWWGKKRVLDFALTLPS